MNRAKTDSMEAVTTVKMHWTTKIGVASVILFMFVVAGLNAVGWINTLPGAGGIAASVVAVSFELMALVAFEHLVAYKKAKDHGRFFLALVGLILAVGMNVEGGHRGLNQIAAPFYAEAEAERRISQDALDETRRDLEAQITQLQTRIDQVAATNPGTDTFSERMAEWRANFELVTADDRAQVASLRARLDQLPLTVAAHDPYPTWGPYAIASIFAFFSVFGLTMFSVKVPGAELQMAGRNAVGALKMSEAMRVQEIVEPARLEAPAILERALEIPPLDELQIREAINALKEKDKKISAANVARFHKVPVACVHRSLAADLVLHEVNKQREKAAFEETAQQMIANGQKMAA